MTVTQACDRCLLCPHMSSLQYSSLTVMYHVRPISLVYSVRCDVHKNECRQIPFFWLLCSRVLTQAASLLLSHDRPPPFPLPSWHPRYCGPTLPVPLQTSGLSAFLPGGQHSPSVTFSSAAFSIWCASSAQAAKGHYQNSIL